MSEKETSAWKAVYDPSTQWVYFVEKETNAATWEDPGVPVDIKHLPEELKPHFEYLMEEHEPVSYFQPEPLQASTTEEEAAAPAHYDYEGTDVMDDAGDIWRQAVAPNVSEEPFWYNMRTLMSSWAPPDPHYPVAQQSYIHNDGHQNGASNAPENAPEQSQQVRLGEDSQQNGMTTDAFNSGEIEALYGYDLKPSRTCEVNSSDVTQTAVSTAIAPVETSSHTRHENKPRPGYHGLLDNDGNGNESTKRGNLGVDETDQGTGSSEKSSPARPSDKKPYAGSSSRHQKTLSNSDLGPIASKSKREHRDKTNDSQSGGDGSPTANRFGSNQRNLGAKNIQRRPRAQKSETSPRSPVTKTTDKATKVDTSVSPSASASPSTNASVDASAACTQRAIEEHETNQKGRKITNLFNHVFRKKPSSKKEQKFGDFDSKFSDRHLQVAVPSPGKDIDQDERGWDRGYFSDSEGIDVTLQRRRLSIYRGKNTLLIDSFKAMSSSKLEHLGNFKYDKHGKKKTRYCYIFKNYLIASVKRLSINEISGPSEWKEIIEESDPLFIDLRFTRELIRKTKSIVLSNVMVSEVKLEADSSREVAFPYRCILSNCWTYGCMAQPTSNLHARLSKLQRMVETSDSIDKCSIREFISQHEIDEESAALDITNTCGPIQWFPSLDSRKLSARKQPSLKKSRSIEGNQVNISPGEWRLRQDKYIDEMVERRLSQINHQRKQKQKRPLTGPEEDRKRIQLKNDAYEDPKNLAKLVMWTKLSTQSQVVDTGVAPEEKISISTTAPTEEAPLDGSQSNLNSSCAQVFVILRKVGWWTDEEVGTLPFDFASLNLKRKELRGNISSSIVKICAFYERMDFESLNLDKGLEENDDTDLHGLLGTFSGTERQPSKSDGAKRIGKLIGYLRQSLCSKEFTSFYSVISSYPATDVIRQGDLWTTIKRVLFCPFVTPPKLWINALDTMLTGVLGGTPQKPSGLAAARRTGEKDFFSRLLKSTASRESLQFIAGRSILNALYASEQQMPEEVLKPLLGETNKSVKDLIEREDIENLDEIFSDTLDFVCNCLARLISDIAFSVGVDPFTLKELRHYHDALKKETLIPILDASEELRGVLHVLKKHCHRAVVLYFLMRDVLLGSASTIHRSFPWFFSSDINSWSLLLDILDGSQTPQTHFSRLRMKCILYGIWRVSNATSGNGTADSYFYPLKLAVLKIVDQVAEPSSDPIENAVSVPLNQISDKVQNCQYICLDTYAFSTVSNWDVAHLYTFGKSMSFETKDERLEAILSEIRRSWNEFKRSTDKNFHWDFEEWVHKILQDRRHRHSSFTRFPLYVTPESAAFCQEISASTVDIPRTPSSSWKDLREKIIRFIGLSDELKCVVDETSVIPGVEDTHLYSLMNHLADEILSKKEVVYAIQLQESSIIAALSLTSKLLNRVQHANNHFPKRGLEPDIAEEIKCLLRWNPQEFNSERKSLVSSHLSPLNTDVAAGYESYRRNQNNTDSS